MTIPSPSLRYPEIDGLPSRVGNALIVIKLRADALRTVRTGILGLAYTLAKNPGETGYLVLADSGITEERLHAEWQRAASVLRSEVLGRLVICVEREGDLRGVPRDPPLELRPAIHEAIDRARSDTSLRSIRPDYSFVILKVLLHQWFVSGEPVTADWLGRTAGCSYPTVARVLKDLGSLVDRTSDRRLRLRYFPRDEFERFAATAETARSTVRFSDRSGQPRSPEARLRRLEKMRPAGVAIGGVLGARHYYPDLDLVGTPRLDLSVHCGEASPGLEFIKELDPALKREDDPRKPASVVLHAVRHADPLFQLRNEGLYWADRVDCLLDLKEAHLESQARQFLEALEESRRTIA